ncbi:hypothetical protein SNEBB_002770 [Seison nebaliae]|nr:hypothetical protein SNEBB_002770 [Seison nebaliae]
MPNSLIDRHLNRRTYGLISSKVDDMFAKGKIMETLRINTGDLTLNDLCDREFLQTIVRGRPRRINNRTEIISYMTNGAQGKVYKIDRVGRRKKVLKIFLYKSGLLLEANGLKAFNTYPIPNLGYELNSMMTNHREIASISFNRFEITGSRIQYPYQDGEGDYCTESTFVEGSELGSNKNFTGSLKKNEKKTLRLLIWLLKQVQVLHFTFNSIAISQPVQRSSFEVSSFTNFHGDIHEGNVIIRNEKLENFEPILIDYGGHLEFFFQNVEDIKLFFYNKFKRGEAGGIAPNMIRINRVFNFGQNLDFCYISLLFLELYVGVLKASIPLNLCAQIRTNLKNDQREKQLNIIRSLYIRLIDYIPLVPIIQQLILSGQQLTTYDVWVSLVNLFKA